jgi:ribosomal protein L37E
METARLLDKVVNYAKAVRQWVAAGRPERTDEEAERLFNEFCNKCSMYNREKGICNSCGCPANTDQPAIKNKLKMATESCPLGQFGPGV